jgi:2-iminobutanoate/2-iminopropanoate deaminase
MTRDARQPEGVARPALPYNPVVVTGDLVFTAGQVALDARGDLVAGGIEAQTAQVLDNLARCLDGVGCSMEDVVKVTAFLADLADADGYNRVYATWFAPALRGSLDGRSAAGRQPARRDRGDRATGRRWSNLLEERRDGVDDPVAVVQDREYAPTIERRAGVRDPAHKEVPDP